MFKVVVIFDDCQEEKVFDTRWEMNSFLEQKMKCDKFLKAKVYKIEDDSHLFTHVRS